MADGTFARGPIIVDKPTGRIVFELFDDKAPKTVERFLKHCKSLRGLREVRNPFPDTYPWDSIGEDPAGGQGGDRRRGKKTWWERNHAIVDREVGSEQQGA